MIQKNLREWFSDQPDEQFPPHGGSPYTSRFRNIADLMNEQVHPAVEKGAILKDGGFLTDHGPRHIETVIRRATSLLSFPEENFPKLSPYEVYLLLLAIHFHDVGNIFGRDKHETLHAKVLQQFEQLIGNEMVEKQAILRIARAHGGRINGSKDTISTLSKSDPVLGHRVRHQTLAAILRFSDELADDSHRASRIGKLLGIIPKESEVYHAYAKSLHSVVVCPEEHLVELHYSFLKEDAIRTFGKKVLEDGLDAVYLLDEIYERTLKMHFERKYCMQFMQEVVRIDALDVRIEVYEDDHSMTPCIEAIGYRLQEQGYPDISSISLKDLCLTVTLDGSTLNDQLIESSQ